MDDNSTISNDGAQRGPSPQSGHEQTAQARSSTSLKQMAKASER